jgi:hypothetical protein
MRIRQPPAEPQKGPEAEARQPRCRDCIDTKRPPPPIGSPGETDEPAPVKTAKQKR